MYFALLVTSITKWCFVCLSAAMTALQFYWEIQCSKAGVSSLWGRLHRGFLCEKILHVYKCRNTHRVLLPGHKVSLVALLGMSFSCAGCSELSGRLCLIQWELNKTVPSDAFLGSQWFAVFTQNLRGLGFLMLVPWVAEHLPYPNFCQDADTPHFSWCQ